MSVRHAVLVIFAFGCTFAIGCSSTLETFTCASNADCASADQLGGQCESSRVCSFADSSCGDDGRRYGNYSGDVSNQCVDGEVGQPDASRIDPPFLPDAGDFPPEDDADPSSNTPDAMNPSSCVTLNMIVFDNNAGDDEVKVLVDGNVQFICSPEPVPIGTDSMAACEYCMPIGATIKLKAESGIDFETLITDCAAGCENQNECVFTATVSCATIHYFDVEHTTIPSPP